MCVVIVRNNTIQAYTFYNTFITNMDCRQLDVKVVNKMCIVFVCKRHVSMAKGSQSERKHLRGGQ